MNNCFNVISKKSLVTICILGVFPLVAQAATTTTTFAVTATVAAACTVTATPLAFGTFVPANATNLDQTNTISVTCTNGTTYAVGLNAGTSSGATVTTRKMTGTTSTSNLLPYELYSNTGRTTNWGNTPGTDTPAASTGTGAVQTLTVYGRIPTNTTAVPDSYSDTITVTVTFPYP
ncbi:MAG: spore coat U domain-containing protein [Proteobacteria bacterium]|nr:spore coat U domain-containing protein [Pseudomonadota bacterium]